MMMKARLCAHVLACAVLIVTLTMIDTASTPVATTLPTTLTTTSLMSPMTSTPTAARNATTFAPPGTGPNRRVTIPPLITKEPPKTVYFREYESIELPCEASGLPTPEYKWQMDEKDFDPSGNDGRIAIQPGVGTLIFARPLARDQAIYQCFAKNTVGTALSVKINLRQAILEPFQTTGIKSNNPNIGDSLQLRCTPPRSFPPASVFWATISEGMRFTPIDLSDRVTQDPIGNLNFVNIVREDSKNGSTYACIAQNSAMRGIGSVQQGEYNQIFPRGQQAVHHSMDIMWHSPTQQVARRGGSVSIKCIFSGNPTPRVDWVRTNGAMPSRAREESFGQQLTIDNVQYSDAGSYECHGINDEAMTPIRRSFRLSVESDPWWVVKPVSVDAAEGESATFECVAESIPRPSSRWYLNGVSMTELPADPRRIATGNTLTFQNLTYKDSMVIQCNVTNKCGYYFTNAYLNVIDEPPFILDSAIMGQKAAEGETINLTCSVYGSPKPLVYWMKVNEKLTGERFLVLEDGSLQISNVSAEDTGSYTCTAENRLGNAQATSSLSVQVDPDDLQEAPVGLSLAIYVTLVGISVCLLIIIVSLVAFKIAKKFKELKVKNGLVDELVLPSDKGKAARQGGPIENLYTSVDYKQPLYEGGDNESGPAVLLGAES